MENKTYQYKTNINCAGCISKVKSSLDSESRILQWNVDTQNTDKILTILANDITSEEIQSLIKDKGFKIESFEKL